MKNTRTHILRTVALSLLIVVTLASFTNVFSANITHAQAAPEAPAAAAPAKTAEQVAAEKKTADAAAAKTAAGDELTKVTEAALKEKEDAIAAAQTIYNTEVAAAADQAAKDAAKAKFDATSNAATAKYDSAVTAATAKYNAAAGVANPDAAPAATMGGQLVGSVLPNNDIIVILSKVLSIVLSMISQLLWPLLMFAGGLMKSDFLYTGAIDLKLSEMWIQVRNLVNIAYVLLLLAVALYNVVGLGETVSMLELKKALPKIILGLVLVNFSYAGVKVVLDVINVGTTFAFSIGQTDARLTQATLLQIQKVQGPICDTIGGGGNLAANIGKDAMDKAIATQCAGKTGAVATKCESDIKALYTKGSASSTAMCVSDGKGGLMINNKVQRYLKSWNVDSSLMVIAIKFMNIQDLPKVSAVAAEGGIAKLTINMLFSLVMFLIYAVSFIVLVVVLFARAAVLWMIIIFSPVIVLNATFPIPGVGGNSSKIVKTLIAPMLIGFVLSIGFILLATMQNINYQGQGTLTSGAPTSSIDTFQDLLVAIGSIVFLWIGIQTATSDTISDKITGPILEGAQSAGTWLAKAPFKYAPLFQIATPHAQHGELQDMGKIGVGFDQAKYAIDTMIGNIDTTRRSDALKAFGVNVDVSMKMTDVRTIDNLRVALSSHPDLEKLKNNPKADSPEFKELAGAVEEIKKRNPDLVRPSAGPGKYDKDFHEFSEAVERAVATKDTTRVKALLPKYLPGPAAAAATPAAPAPTAAESTAAVAINNETTVKPVIVALKAGDISKPKDTAEAIKKYSDAFASIVDVKKRGEAIGKHLKTKAGVTNKANAKKTLDASVAELKVIMPDGDDAQDIIDEINKAL